MKYSGYIRIAVDGTISLHSIDYRSGTKVTRNGSPATQKAFNELPLDERLYLLGKAHERGMSYFSKNGKVRVNYPSF